MLEHDQLPARTQHAIELGQGPLDLTHRTQHQAAEHGIDTAIGQPGVVGEAAAQLDGATEPLCLATQRPVHGLVGFETDPAHLRRQVRQRGARAGADLEDRALGGAQQRPLAIAQRLVVADGHARHEPGEEALLSLVGPAP